MADTNPLLAKRRDTTTTWAGIWIAEDIHTLDHGIRSGSWIDTSIGGVATSLDALGFISDPLGSLVQWGAAWLIEHVKPLSDALDWLAGDPDQITAHAQTWRNIAAATTQAATDLHTTAARDTAGWTGAAADAYRAHAGEQHAALHALGQAANTMALITETAGLLVALVRTMVRDLIAGFVSIIAVRLSEWAAEEAGTLGAATPLVIEQVSVLVAQWATRIARLLRALITSLRQLKPALRHLDELLTKIKDTLHRRGRPPTGKGGGHNDPSRKHDNGSGPGHDSDRIVPPDFNNPTIDGRKISDYVMDPGHPVGKNKFRVINPATGLDSGDAAEIGRQIAEGVRHGTPIPGRADEYGQRWSVDVTLTGPTGSIVVRTGWIVDPGSTIPRMTTISFPPKGGDRGST